MQNLIPSNLDNQPYIQERKYYINDKVKFTIGNINPKNQIYIDLHVCIILASPVMVSMLLAN